MLPCNNKDCVQSCYEITVCVFVTTIVLEVDGKVGQWTVVSMIIATMSRVK